MYIYNVLILMGVYIHPHIYLVTTKTSGDMVSQISLSGYLRHLRDM